jgi:hypothetical protein
LAEEEALMLLLQAAIAGSFGIVGDNAEYGPESFFCTDHDAGLMGCWLVIA